MRLGRASKSTLGKRRETSIPEETTIGIRGEYITLQQLLKMAGVIGTGGEAKIYLAATVVMVNGEPEQRRGRKLRLGDLIIAPGAAPIRLVAGNDEED
jgi:ribosome-associated protein